ncbi:hypothetical protein OIV83_005782 [Microbotryomycetes sp. JL201]|nr:hypothetical protein OIV83_005782 [Microbotryomycetes sp. JL201]
MCNRYGSLIFKPPPFPTITSEPGYIKGYVRRFAQKSHDHRGTEDNPGRGRVYRIPEDDGEEIWAYLDHREKDGYTVRHVDVYNLDEQGREIVVEHNCRVYVGETDNPSFAGGEPMLELARRIAKSEGPSGLNRDYLYKLAQAVRILSKEDDAYLLELERLVREAETEMRKTGKTL